MAATSISPQTAPPSQQSKSTIEPNFAKGGFCRPFLCIFAAIAAKQRGEKEEDIAEWLKISKGLSRKYESNTEISHQC
jgi:hypothetical protein